MIYCNFPEEINGNHKKTNTLQQNFYRTPTRFELDALLLRVLCVRYAKAAAPVVTLQALLTPSQWHPVLDLRASLKGKGKTTKTGLLLDKTLGPESRF